MENSKKATEEEFEKQHALSVKYESWSNDLIRMNDQLFEDYRQALKERNEKGEGKGEEDADWW